jgi:hypothetical protein
MSKSLVGVGEWQLGTKDSNVTLPFSFMCENLLRKKMVSFVYVVCSCCNSLV